SFLFLDGRLNRPLHGSPNNHSPSAAQLSHAALSTLPKSVTRFSPCQRARQLTTVASTRLPVSTLCQMPSLHRHRNGMTYVPTRSSQRTSRGRSASGTPS